MNAKQHIQRCFNKAYLSYDAHNSIQQLAGNILIRQIHSLYQQKFSNIIDLGCANGTITQRLADTLTYDNFFALDTAEKLLSSAREKLKFYPHIKIIQADFDQIDCLNLTPKMPFKQNAFSLIFSNMSLQWSLDFKNLLHRIYKHLDNHGVIAFSIPILGTFSELEKNSRHDFLCAHQVNQYLSQAGFEKGQHHTKCFSMVFESMIKALQSIKSTGANYVFNSCFNALQKYYYLRNKTLLYLRQPFSLSYHIGFFIARKN